MNQRTKLLSIFSNDNFMCHRVRVPAYECCFFLRAQLTIYFECGGCACALLEFDCMNSTSCKCDANACEKNYANTHSRKHCLKMFILLLNLNLNRFTFRHGWHPKHSICSTTKTNSSSWNFEIVCVVRACTCLCVIKRTIHVDRYEWYVTQFMILFVVRSKLVWNYSSSSSVSLAAVK